MGLPPFDQDDWDYLADPFGRTGKWERKPKVAEARAPHDPDRTLAIWRDRWKRGGLARDLGEDIFVLRDSVGPDGRNRRDDVGKVELLLEMAGHRPLAGKEGPTGYFGFIEQDAIEDFQQENGLTVDGTLRPGGETIGKMASLLAPRSAGPTGGAAGAGGERPGIVPVMLD